MSDIIDEITFEGYGLDTDSSEKYMLPGNAPYALNILKGEDGVYGEITNLKGNRIVQYTPPDNHPWKNCNVYFTLCSCYDPLTRNVYYWVFSQPVDVTGSGDYEYDNRLLRFNEDTEIIDTIFCDDKNYFGLDPVRPFKDSFVLGDWLYFNPQTSEPKMICITMAYNYTNYLAYDSTLTYSYGDKRTYFGGLFLALEAVAVGETPVTNPGKWDRIDDCYQYESVDPNIDSEFRYAFNVIKRPPTPRPYCYYGTDANVRANNIKKSLFQFACRYQYFDDTYSLYSAFSDVTLPPHTEYINGDIPNNSTLANYIAVNFNLHSAALVKRVEIIFRESSSWIAWRRCETIDRQDIAILDKLQQTFIFFNDKSYLVIDSSRIEIPQDSVPPAANCQEIINKNILCYAGVTEGFNNLPKEDILVNLTAQIEALAIPESVTAVRHDNLQPESILYYQNYTVWDYGDWTYTWAPGYVVQSRTAFYADWFVGAGLQIGDKYLATIDGVTHEHDIVALDILNESVFIGAMWAFFNSEFGLTGTIGFEDGHWNIMFPNVHLKVTQSIFYDPSGSAVTTVTKHRGFKTGALHPFCIYYYDLSLRRWDAQVSKENINDISAWNVEGTTAYVPSLNEYAPAGDTTAYKFNITWEVNHMPPAGASYWRWGYAGNSLCSYFVQYIIQAIGVITEADEPLNSIYIDIEPLQTVKSTDVAGWNQFPNSIIAPYEWVEGDRIRFITETTAGVTAGPLVNGVYDMEIIKQDIENHRIYVSATDFNYAGVSINTKSLVEIYRPKKEDTEVVYYEFGELMPVLEDEYGLRCHGSVPVGGVDQDWATSTPASGTFTAGDIYHLIRTPSFPISFTYGFFHESAWYSDFYDSDFYDRGRMGIEGFWGQRYLNIVRHSNQYLANTRINGLSTFEGNNLKELNDVFGDVLRIIEIGDTLKVYQRKKPSSILIGRTEYTDSSGEPNVVATSNRVLGSIRYSSTNYGTEFPESISRNNRFVYGFDVYNGVMWRDSPNGIFPISGKFESAQGVGSYRMETWFKDKAKALLVSGLSHCNVITVWDENHKNLYVIFKDAVEEANDVAIMFHEPSNRWICFTDMGYTPVEGWDQILELSYETLWGFEAGIGYEFDEDTRFAFFNIGAKASGNPGDPGSGTTPNIRAFPTVVKLEIVPYAPLVSTEETATPAVVSLEIVPYAPEVKVYSIAVDTDTFEWDWDQFGVPELKLCTFTLGTHSEWVAIDHIPTWLTIKANDGSQLSAWDYIYPGDTISLYPTGANYTAGDLAEAIGFIDNSGGSVSIYVFQFVGPYAPVVNYGYDYTFDLSDFSYEAIVGTDFITINFRHDLTEDTWKKLVVYDSYGIVLYSGTGYPYGVLLAGDSYATKIISLWGHTIIEGDIFWIEIGELT